MEAAYGIGIKNRYALFMGNEEVDPLDIITKPPKEDNRSLANLNSESIKFDSSSISKDGKNRNSNKKSTNAASNKSEKENQLGSKDIFNGGSNADNISSNAKTKTNRTSSNKFNPSDRGAGDENRKSGSGRGARGGGNFRGARGTGRGGRGGSTEDRGKRQFDNRISGSTKTEKPFTNFSTNDFESDIQTFNDTNERSTKVDGDLVGDSKHKERLDDGSRRGGRGGRGGFRGGRGGGRRGNFDDRGKRQYDRHSGSDKSGVKPIEKKDGHGAFNWGTATDDFEAIANQGSDDIHDNAERSGDENVGDSSEAKEAQIEDWNDLTNADNKPKEETVEEPRQMTLEEFKRMEEEKRVLPKFNLRKSGEGEDNSQWKKTYVLKKKVDEEEEEYEEVEVEEEIRHGRQKRVLNIDIKFTNKNENGEMRRGRGGRGGGPRGGRGGRRGDRDGAAGGGGPRRSGRESKEQSAPRFDDMNDFPSLATA